MKLKSDVTSYDTKSLLIDRLSTFPAKSKISFFTVCSFSANGAKYFESALAVSYKYVPHVLLIGRSVRFSMAIWL